MSVCSVLFAQASPVEMDSEKVVSKPSSVMVIPIKNQIANPEWFILRRGLKEAMDKNIDTVVLDMETPGGALDVTFEMLKGIEKFPGRVITYVNREAISAGALIAAATDDIYFAPGGLIGAAAPVLATGQEIDEVMREKIVSYLAGRVRAVTEGKGYRADVINAMVDINSEYKIGDRVLKEKGKLLTLTATEALEKFGDPPVPLLGAGIYENLESLLDSYYGKGKYEIIRLEVTWSEKLAQYITGVAPVLLALGILGLFIEFKTPGFGFFGITGILLLAVVFLGHMVAGLSGHEPLLLFLGGIVLIAVEIFFIPGIIILIFTGVMMILVALIWSMADIWPSQSWAFDPQIFVNPAVNLGIGLLLAIILFFLILRFLPNGGIWNRMVLKTAVGGEPLGPGHALHQQKGSVRTNSLTGLHGVAVTDLFPSGHVEIAGKRYEARVLLGYIKEGTPIVVQNHDSFSLQVTELKS